MFDHVTVRAADRDASQRFYETVLPQLGIEPTYDGDDLVEWSDFSIAAGEATRRLRVAFVTLSRAAVDAFWRAGVAAGYESDGEPGPRPQYHPGYYAAFVRDPDGTNVEVVAHDRASA